MGWFGDLGLVFGTELVVSGVGNGIGFGYFGTDGLIVNDYHLRQAGRGDMFEGSDSHRVTATN